MRRLLPAAVLAVPAFLINTEVASANPPPGLAQYGCAGFCMKMFPFIHQHGPLFNYGPYYGYYPFEPYGPWDAYLRYNGGGMAPGGYAAPAYQPAPTAPGTAVPTAPTVAPAGYRR